MALTSPHEFANVPHLVLINQGSKAMNTMKAKRYNKGIVSEDDVTAKLAKASDALAGADDRIKILIGQLRPVVNQWVLSALKRSHIRAQAACRTAVLAMECRNNNKRATLAVEAARIARKVNYGVEITLEMLQKTVAKPLDGYVTSALAKTRSANNLAEAAAIASRQLATIKIQEKATLTPAGLTNKQLVALRPKQRVAFHARRAQHHLENLEQCIGSVISGRVKRQLTRSIRYTQKIVVAANQAENRGIDNDRAATWRTANDSFNRAMYELNDVQRACGGILPAAKMRSGYDAARELNMAHNEITKVWQHRRDE